MKIPLNLEFMANPYNWIVLTLMVLFAVYALQLVSPSSVQPSEG